MRDANFKSVVTNRAAVTITSSLYDRRALDVTEDKPLVNSLNYLTYLVSSSPKVRDTLSKDGGIERLVEILHECHNSTFNTNNPVFRSERMLLTAWKWTLAFQCLVLIGTRGTEKIRTKVVDAGILPIIATVLDNYVSLNERMFIHANSRQNPTLCTANGLSSTPTATPNPSSLATGVSTPNQNNSPQHPRSRTSVPVNAPFGGEIPSYSENFNMQVISEQENLGSQENLGRQETLSNQSEQQQLQQQQQQQQQQQSYQGPQGNLHSERVQQGSVQQGSAQQGSTLQEGAPQGVPLMDRVSQHRIQGLPRSQTDQVNPTQPSTVRNPPSFTRHTTFPHNSSNSFASPFPAHAPYIPFCNNNRQNNLTCEDYDNLSVDQLFKMIKFNHFTGPVQNPTYINDTTNNKNCMVNNDLRKQYMIVNILKKLRSDAESEVLDDIWSCPEVDLDSNLQFLSDMYLQDSEKNRSMMHAKVAVRHFTDTGVVIPRDDDIVWSLQLLAYISKYPYLKESLQNTHLVIDMSIRHKQMKLYLQNQLKLSMRKSASVNCRPTITPKSRKTKNKNTYRKADPAQVLNDSMDSPFVVPETSKFGIHDPSTAGNQRDAEAMPNMSATCLGIEEDAELEDDDESNTDNDGDNECEVGEEVADELESEQINECIANNSKYLTELFDSIVACESIENEFQRKVKLHMINDKMAKFIEMEGNKLRGAIVAKRKQVKKAMEKKWDYDTYDGFDIDDKKQDLDDSLVEQEKVNLFPLVEKFTFLLGTDIYYWAGVIMRNSCRRNEMSIRQCGNLECGRWETRPREFSKCRRCKRTKYCSRECQMKSWHCHRNWCIPSTSSNSTHTTSSTTVTSSNGAAATNQAEAVDQSSHDLTQVEEN